MLNKSICFSILLFINLGVQLSSFAQEVLKNEDVVFMLGIGLSEEVVITKIDGTFNNFDISIAGLKGLNDAKVPQNIITAVVKAANNPNLKYQDPNDPLSYHSGGFYYIKNKLLERLEFSAYSQGKTSGKYLESVSRGLVGPKLSIMISDSTSRQSFLGSPEFYFYAEVGAESSFQGFEAQSPNSFICVKLESDKNARSVQIGSSNIDGAKSGIGGESTVSFEFERLKDGIYRVYFKEPLEKGEYAFMNIGNLSVYINNKGAGTSNQNRAFDFSVN